MRHDRLNLVLLLAVMASALYLVRTQYESRRLFTEIDRAQAEARRLEVEAERLQVEKRAQSTPGRVERWPRSSCRCARPHRPSRNMCSTAPQRPPQPLQLSGAVR
jgi:cell division protein FtsL